jgi:hypothetical protein
VAEIISLFGDRDGTDGGGPEDPMLDQRVTKLEEVINRVDERLTNIESDLKHLPTAMDYAALRADVAEIKGRVSGFDSRLGNLPTTWTLLGIVFTTWALGSGILIFAMSFLKR